MSGADAAAGPTTDLAVEMRKIPGIAMLGGQDFESLSAAVYKELELRVGTQLSRGLTDDQLGEFEQLADYEQNHPELAARGLSPTFDWLKTTIPDYRAVVRQVMTGLLAELAASFG